MNGYVDYFISKLFCHAGSSSFHSHQIENSRNSIDFHSDSLQRRLNPNFFFARMMKLTKRVEMSAIKCIRDP